VRAVRVLYLNVALTIIFSREASHGIQTVHIRAGVRCWWKVIRVGARLVSIQVVPLPKANGTVLTV